MSIWGKRWRWNGGKKKGEHRTFYHKGTRETDHVGTSEVQFNPGIQHKEKWKAAINLLQDE